MCSDLSKCEAYQRGRAAVKDNPAPEHVVAIVNRALRAARRGERGDDDAELRLVEIAR
jgi:hypothetical protein